MSYEASSTTSVVNKTLTLTNTCMRYTYPYAYTYAFTCVNWCWYVNFTDINRSKDFYIRLLGMTLVRQQDYPKGRFTNLFLSYADDETNKELQKIPENDTEARRTFMYTVLRSHCLELTHNWEHPPTFTGYKVFRCRNICKYGVHIPSFH
jgi:hypothetical protein